MISHLSKSRRKKKNIVQSSRGLIKNNIMFIGLQVGEHGVVSDKVLGGE